MKISAIAIAACLVAMLNTTEIAIAQEMSPQTLRTFASLDGAQIRCDTPMMRDPDMMRTTLESAPQDLDELSTRIQAIFDPASPLGAQFRAMLEAQRASDWPQLCRYRDANAHILESGHRPIAVFMGDSITDNWVVASPGFFESGNYRGRGISGQTSAQMVARFYTDVVMLRPQVVHIMSGTNDIAANTGPLTEEEYLANIRAMIDMAKANNIAVVLASLPPMTRVLQHPDFDARSVVRRLNIRLAELARDKGATFVDYYTPLALEDGSFDPEYANDGVHPTRRGYGLIEPLTLAAISTAVAN